ncbi:MAG: radical SAM protein [Elusimicrobia bacterium]|nr:radical SAM protein [Elusimicrobiota bacterium]
MSVMQLSPSPAWKEPIRGGVNRGEEYLNSRSVGLYVHVPFCSGKCFYCDFVSVPVQAASHGPRRRHAHASSARVRNAGRGQGRHARRYLEALEAEMRLRPSCQPRTLYIGGGTPSELEAGELAGLLAAVRRSYATDGIVEATCEANPESLTADKLSALRRGGVARLSLGLQTTENRLLRRIGRRHDFACFLEAYRAARGAGFEVSVDLMFGLPGQTVAGLRGSIDAVLALEPGHLSLYGLDVHDSTLFGERGVRHDEDLGREMFEISIERLAREGYHHYEISNFALPGRESIHNQIYWRNEEYVGLGCAAASYINGERSTNVDRLQDYCDAALSGRRPVAYAETLRGRERLGEGVMLGLRLLDGFEPEPEALAAFAPEIAALAAKGLLRREGPRLRLTREGVFLANVVASEFVPPFEHPSAETVSFKEAIA